MADESNKPGPRSGPPPGPENLVRNERADKDRDHLGRRVAQNTDLTEQAQENPEGRAQSGDNPGNP